MRTKIIKTKNNKPGKPPASNKYPSSEAQKEINLNSLAEIRENKKIIISNIIEMIYNPGETASSELEKVLDDTLYYCEGQSKLDENCSLGLFISSFSDRLHASEDSILTLLENCKIHLFDNGVKIANKESDTSIEKITDNTVEAKQDELLTQANQLILEQKKMSLDDYLNINLPGYKFSLSSVFNHPLYNRISISCYPEERYDAQKVEIYKRLSKDYKLPEKIVKYTRPILDIEIHRQYGPCVRCYLTILARPRLDSQDKDIIQDPKGNVLLKNVNLMNFGDPLRAFTWVEDYIKNDEHGHINNIKPIIRSFLITLEEYQRTLTKSILVEVDSDRAPGQVRVQGGYLELKTVPNSLVSFTDQNSREEDGVVLSLTKLGEFLFDTPIHPSKLAEDNYIAHQHGRLIENSNKRYEIPNPHVVIQARQLERELSGHALEPKTRVEKESSFVIAAQKQEEKYKFFTSKNPSGMSKERLGTERNLALKGQALLNDKNPNPPNLEIAETRHKRLKVKN